MLAWHTRNFVQSATFVMKMETGWHIFQVRIWYVLLMQTSSWYCSTLNCALHTVLWFRNAIKNLSGISNHYGNKNDLTHPFKKQMYSNRRPQKWSTKVFTCVCARNHEWLMTLHISSVQVTISSPVSSTISYSSNNIM